MQIYLADQDHFSKNIRSLYSFCNHHIESDTVSAGFCKI